LYADLDQRITDLAKAGHPRRQPMRRSPSPPVRWRRRLPRPAAGGSPQSDPLVESRSYETALKLFREANYAGAIAGFNGFLKAYPASALAPNAQYWIGYSYYVLKDYKSALAHQQKLVAVYPASDKVPDALLNIAANQIALDNVAGARKTLEGLVPSTPAPRRLNWPPAGCLHSSKRRVRVLTLHPQGVGRACPAKGSRGCRAGKPATTTR